MRFIFTFLFLMVFHFTYAQIEECPCNPTAIDCPCPNDYETPPPPTVTPPPDPIPNCADFDYSEVEINEEDFTSGFEDGWQQTHAFINLHFSDCQGYGFLGSGTNSTLEDLYTIPNPEWVVEPQEPQLMSIPNYDPYVQDDSQIVPVAEGGVDPVCTIGLSNGIIQLSGIIADKIDQEINSPGSTGFSLSYWLGFCTGFGAAN